jgi:hypothetical protein
MAGNPCAASGILAVDSARGYRRADQAVRANCSSSTPPARCTPCGITYPTGVWAFTAPATLALDLGEQLRDFHFLIRDRGSNFGCSFDAVSKPGLTIAYSRKRRG